MRLDDEGVVERLELLLLSNLDSEQVIDFGQKSETNKNFNQRIYQKT